MQHLACGSTSRNVLSRAQARRRLGEMVSLMTADTSTYNKTCVSQKERKLVFKTNYPLMQVKSIAECSKWSILQYFRPSLSYHLSLRSLLCLFLSGLFAQVLLYMRSKMYMGNLIWELKIKTKISPLKSI